MHSFQAAVRVQAGDPLAHFRIGNTLFALKKYTEARKVYSWIVLVKRSALADMLMVITLKLLFTRTNLCGVSIPIHPSVSFPPVQAYGRALKCCKPGVAADEALQPKVYVNLGITQEAEGLLMSACDHYK
jgi:hypothetical protein